MMKLGTFLIKSRLSLNQINQLKEKTNVYQWYHERRSGMS